MSPSKGKESSDTNIFFVYNAFIYLNAIELKHHLGLLPKDCVLVVNTFRIKNLRQLLNIIDPKDWSNIYYTYFDIDSVTEEDLKSDSNSRFGFAKLFFLYLAALRRLKKIKKNHPKINFLVNGIYKDYLVSHYANTTKYNKYYYLDDGNMTLFVNNNIRKYESEHDFKEKFFEGNWKENLFFKMIQTVLNMKIKPTRSLSYFTSHELVENNFDHYEQNRYAYLSRNISNKLIQPDLVYFLGGPLIEITICTEQHYHAMIQSIKDYYGDKKIIYLPHRFENVTELEKLRTKFDLEILKHDMPIELFLSINDETPQTIASFYSSALGNLNVFLPEVIELHAFEIAPEEIIPNNKRRMIGEIYSRYRELSQNYPRVKVIPAKKA